MGIKNYQPDYGRLLELGVHAIRDETGTTVIWSPGVVPKDAIFKACARLHAKCGIENPFLLPVPSDSTMCDRCGHMCNVLYVNGVWKCSSCDPLADARMQAVARHLSEHAARELWQRDNRT